MADDTEERILHPFALWRDLKKVDGMCVGMEMWTSTSVPKNTILLFDSQGFITAINNIGEVPKDA